MKEIALRHIIIGMSLAVLAVPAAGQNRLFEDNGLPDQANVIARDRVASSHSYFGKRSRLVRINAGVLVSDEPFELKLFEDSRLLIRNLSIEEFVPGSWGWTGEVIEPRVPVFQVDGPPLTQAQQDELENSAHRIELTLVESKDIGPTEKGDRSEPDNSKSEPDNSKSSDSFGPAVPEKSVSRAFEPTKRYWIQGEISVPALGSVIRIVPIESTRDIHVVVDVDPGKTFFVPEVGVTLDESEENRRKREEYQAFKKQRESSVGSQ